MKSKGFILKLALLILLTAAAIFLFLTYKTMDKQNHVIPILEYHNFTADANMLNPWTVSVNDFNDQMSYINQFCNVVPLKTLMQNMKQGQTIPEHTVAVTFDDGYQSNYLLAYPILEKYRIPTTIFVIGNYTENGTGGGYQALTWSDLKPMVSSGLVDIESHTYDLHNILADSSGKRGPAVFNHKANYKGNETQNEYDQRIESDLAQSRQVIETNLGTDSVILSWPFGATDDHINTLAKNAGFVYMIGPTGYSNPATDIRNIGRVIVPGGMGLTEFEKLVRPSKVSFSQALGLQLERIKYHLIHVFARK